MLSTTQQRADRGPQGTERRAVFGVLMTVLVGFFACGLATSLWAQQQPFPAGPRTIVGVVVDTNGIAIDSAQVYITGPRDREWTSPTGTFRLTGVKPEIAVVTVRKVGYFPQSKRVIMQANGSSVKFELVRLATNLPAVVTVAKTSGLSGVVGDTSYAAITDALVRVVASGAGSTQTDSMGAFFLPVKPGRYMVEIRKAGYVPQFLSVSIPENEGRRLSVLMTPGANEFGARTAAYLDAFRERQIYRSAAYSRMFTREDMTKMNADMAQLASIGSVSRVDESCIAYIDGGRERVPLWAMNPMDYEFVEVYARSPTAPGAVSRFGNTPDWGPLGAQRSRQTGGAAGMNGGRSGIGGGAMGGAVNADGTCRTTIYAWTRK